MKYKVIRRMKIKEFSEVVSGSTPKTNIDEYWEGKYPWITPAEINLDTKYITDTERKLTDKGIHSSSLKLLKKGTVLLTSRAPIGKVAIAGVDLYCNQGFKNLVCDQNIVLPEYLYYWLSSQTEYLNSLGRGATFKEISKSIVEDIDVPVPTVFTQEKIVNILDKAQELIDKRKEQIEACDELIKGLFYDMFGDPVTNIKSWEKDKLGNRCTVYRGGSPRPISEFLGGIIPWIKIGDATQGDNIYLNSTKEHIIEEGMRKSRLVKKGSLIFANCGVSLGFARIVNFDGCIHDGWLSFEDISIDIDKIFLLKLLNCYTDYFRRTAPDGTQPNLNTSIMKDFEIIIPPIKLQKDFVKLILRTEQQKSLMQQSLTQLENNFNSLMQRAFKGELF